MLRNALIVSLLLPLALQAAGEPAQRLAVLTVETGTTDRVDTPVGVALPAQINAFRQMRLVENTASGQVPVPAQVEQGEVRKLWWILAGKTPAGLKRTYELLRGTPVFDTPVALTLTGQNLDVSVRGAPLFSYRHAHVPPPEKANPAYIRSGYINPLFSPAGQLLTEDFPGDHYHHKGIWMPWTNTTFKGHKVDFWNLRDKLGTVQYAGFQCMESGPVYGRFCVKHEHVDITLPNGGTVVLDEVWDVRVWAVGGREGGYWLWDLTSSQTCVADSPLHLKAYHYGGIGYRGPKEWRDDNYQVLTSNGHTKANGHLKFAKWCAHSGAVKEKPATVVLMCHPSNERFAAPPNEGEPMRIWPSGGCFFNFVPIQKEPMDLKPGETHIFRYRWFIHQGGIDRERSERTWQDFGAPPVATLKLAN